MITATTMTLGSPIGTDNLSKHANFVIHNGAKMLSVSVDNSGGMMAHMARADIRCLFSNNTAGISGREDVEDVTALVFGGDRADIVRGTVRRFERSDVVIDLGRYEASLPSRERVPIEEYQPGEQLRCFVKAVEETGRGPEIVLSRSDPDFVVKLFTLEVSEIADGTVQIVSVAREPGWRTKLAVHSDDQRVDPVGACVGLRGQRVKNIVRELNNEKVDIIHWSPNIEEFVTEALKPAELREIEVHKEEKRIQVWVAEDQLSLAIGKRGQNARLASRLSVLEERKAPKSRDRAKQRPSAVSQQGPKAVVELLIKVPYVRKMFCDGGRGAFKWGKPSKVSYGEWVDMNKKGHVEDLVQ